LAILKVARIGHPVIRKTARNLSDAEIRSPRIQRLIDDMIETMVEYEGVGLAGPQVHESLRLAVIQVDASDDRTEDAVPLTVLINPVVTFVGQERVNGFEGCLSIPDLRGVVPRARKVRLEARDRKAKRYALETDTFFARVIQHECDHLDGEVYLDRMDGMRTLGFLNEFERFAHGEDE
jgi:peptide deformylase